MNRATLVRVFDTSAGFISITGNERALRRVFLPEPTRDCALSRAMASEPNGVIDENDRLLPSLVEDLQRYFRGERVKFSVAIDWDDCPPLHREIWRACRRISYGQTASYGDLARAVGRSGAARAVGTAMGRNRCPIVVPCHRVLRSDGSIGGFSSPRGVCQKRELLELEQRALGQGLAFV